MESQLAQFQSRLAANAKQLQRGAESRQKLMGACAFMWRWWWRG